MNIALSLVKFYRSHRQQQPHHVESTRSGVNCRNCIVVYQRQCARFPGEKIPLFSHRRKSGDFLFLMSRLVRQLSEGILNNHILIKHYMRRSLPVFREMQLMHVCGHFIIPKKSLVRQDSSGFYRTNFNIVIVAVTPATKPAITADKTPSCLSGCG